MFSNTKNRRCISKKDWEISCVFFARNAPTVFDEIYGCSPFRMGSKGSSNLLRCPLEKSHLVFDGNKYGLIYPS